MFRQLLHLRAPSGQSAATPRRSHGAGAMIAVGVTVAGVGAVVWWTVESGVLTRHPLVQAGMLPLVVLLLVLLVILRNDRRWQRPARRMLTLLEQIRNGEAPIDELSQIDGGLRPLVGPIQNLLHDLRQQRTAVAVMEQEMSQRIANRTVALERQIGSLRQQAVRDALTGLFNRRMLDSFLPPLAERCIAEKTDLSLLVIDLDYFKLLNDTLGHAAGDNLLRDIGSIIRSGVREQDAAFRVGGDEFVVVMPGASPIAVASLADRLRDLVDALVKPLHLAHPPRLSFGRISLSELGGSPSAHELLKLADKRLYEMKAGRRRTAAAVLKAG